MKGPSPVGKGYILPLSSPLHRSLLFSRGFSAKWEINADMMSCHPT